MPAIGLGTLAIDGREAVTIAIQSALKLGYRRIDCAPVYFNEHLIGDVLAEEFQHGRLNRDEVYLTSKLACPFHQREHVELALRKTLSDLRVDYLDLYLIHWPVAWQPMLQALDTTKRGYENEDIDSSLNGKLIDPSVSVHDTWAGMEGLVDKGLVKQIGVSNFPVILLHELMTKSRIPPAVNQVELHPYLQQPKLLKYCRKRGVHVQAYSPLGTPGLKEEGEPNLLEDPLLSQIAAAHGASVAQICIAWALQQGTSVVAKSASPKHQKENMVNVDGYPTITLSDKEITEIESLDRGYRFFRPDDWWDELAMAVFD